MNERPQIATAVLKVQGWDAVWAPSSLTASRISL